MATLKTLKIESSLQKKGFKKDNSHHKFYILYYDGKKPSIKTKVSHSSDEINDFLIKKMSRQTKLTSNEFIDLINCPLSYQQYIRILINKGEICNE